MTQARAYSGENVGPTPPAEADGSGDHYRLEQQVGFLLRLAGQRHRAIFMKTMPADLTPRQWAVLARLDESGASPQNLLGRRTAMDAATIKGVVDRLAGRGLIEVASDVNDARRRTIALTASGVRLVREVEAAAQAITDETLAPLTKAQQDVLLTLLTKIS